MNIVFKTIISFLLCITPLFATDDLLEYAQHKTLLETTCASNKALACKQVGDLYLGEKAYPQAKNYYDKACSLNNAQGCYQIGQMYDKGQGINHNNALAKTYYKKACDLREEKGCFALKGVKDVFFKKSQFFNK